MKQTTPFALRMLLCLLVGMFLFSSCKQNPSTQNNPNNNPDGNDQQEEEIVTDPDEKLPYELPAQEDLSLDKVADFVGISKYYFAREFRRITGYTFVTHLNMTRCEAAKELLSRSVAVWGVPSDAVSA